MNKETNTDEEERDKLRRRAESQITRKQAPPALAEEDAQRLMHDLEVYQVELERQNEELRRAQQELSESRDRYFELYDLAPVGYLTLDREGKILESNLAASAFFGEDRTRFTGRSLAAFLQQSEADALHHHLREVFEQDSKRSCELTLTPPGGDDALETKVRLESICFNGPNGQRRCRTVLVDLSELRDAQAARRSGEARDQALLDTTGDAILVGDHEGRILSANKAAERLFGYPQAELLGKRLCELMPLEYQADLDQGVERFLLTGDLKGHDSKPREVVGLRARGSIFSALLNIGSWSENGEPRFTAVLRDNTKEKATEAALAEEATRFQEITEVIDDVFYIMDEEHRVQYLSPAYERLWGHSAESVIVNRSQWLEDVHPEDQSRVREAHDAVASGGFFEAEYRIVRPDGAVRWIRDRVFPVPSESGQIERYVGCAQDITSAKQLEEELAQVQRIEAVGALASSVAHDFGNVLQAVLGCVNLARREGLSRKRMLEYLDRASSAARRGGKLAEQLLSFARKRNTEPAPVELDALIKGSARLLEGLMTEQVAVKIQTAARGVQILADAVQIEQILLNLASNARDAMPEGGKLVICTEVVGADGSPLPIAGSTPTEGYVCLEVSDTGVGMSAETKRRMFDPFFTTKEVGKGTGLGLSTVLSTATKLGARVNVRSEPGEGTTFTLLFPIHEELSESKTRRVHKELRFSGTILLVEDEPTIRMTLRHKLEELGFDVLEAADPVEAEYVCGLHHGELNLLLSDVVLPVMSGPKLAERLRASYPNLEVLLMSASYDLHPQPDEPASGVFPVLRKPFSKFELCAALEKLMPSESVERVFLPPPPPVSKKVTPAVSSSPSAPSEPIQSGSSSQPGRSDQPGAVVMVVDDEAAALGPLRDFLEGEGHRVLTASTPREALDLADLETCIDVLIADLQLPQMSGHDFTARVRERHPNVRAIIMSALPEEPDEEDAFLPKPFDLDHLAKLVDQLLA